MVLKAGKTGTHVTILTTVIVVMTVNAETIMFLRKTLTKQQVKLYPMKKKSYTLFALKTLQIP